MAINYLSVEHYLLSEYMQMRFTCFPSMSMSIANFTGTGTGTEELKEPTLQGQ